MVDDITVGVYAEETSVRQLEKDSGSMLALFITSLY
jgi:hypothetical protein